MQGNQYNQKQFIPVGQGNNMYEPQMPSYQPNPVRSDNNQGYMPVNPPYNGSDPNSGRYVPPPSNFKGPPMPSYQNDVAYGNQPLVYSDIYYRRRRNKMIFGIVMGGVIVVLLVIFLLIR